MGFFKKTKNKNPCLIAALRYGDNYGSPIPKFGGDPRPGSAPMSGGQFSDIYREPQVVYFDITVE